jgi:tRNA dimethylallyltransferase
LTWFRKNDCIHWIFLDGIDKKNEILEKCEKAMAK